MSSPLLTWKPWIWLSILVACAIATKFIPPFAARALFVALTCIVTWSFWALGVQLFQALQAPASLNLFRFRTGLIYLLGYIAIIIWFPSDEFLLNNHTPAAYGWRWAIWPLGLGFVYFHFYALYFLSKCIVLLRKKSGFDEPVLLYMLFFWFFPVGIFVLHPRLIELLVAPGKEQEAGYLQ